MRVSPSAIRIVATAALIAGCPATLLSQILTPPPDRTTVTVMSDATPPSGLSITGSPAKAVITWQPVSTAVKYTIRRTLTQDPTCCNAQSGDLTTNRWEDTGVQSTPGTYAYTVTAWRSDGHYGQTTMNWMRPEAINPRNFVAKQTGEGAVELTWYEVPYASAYWLWGPGIGSEGIRVDGTKKAFTGVPAGPNEWTVTTRYDPAGFLTPSTTWPKAQLNVAVTRGMYRVTLNGFAVSTTPTEDAVTFDGAGSEVFALNYIRTYDRTNGSILNQGVVESAVHGDTEGFGGRVPAGSAKPTGGLIAGDKFPSPTPWTRGNSVSPITFPLLLWEGPLNDGKEVVVVSPFIWEWNGTLNEFNRASVIRVVNEEQKNAGVHWQQVASALSSQSSSWGGPAPIGLSWSDDVNAIAGGSTSDITIFNKTEIRAIGASVPYSRDKKLYIIPNIGIVITRELIEKALSNTSPIGGMGPGIIPITWQDKFPNGKGNITLYLQVARQ